MTLFLITYPTPHNPVPPLPGDCDRDEDCSGTLTCKQRGSGESLASGGKIHGCDAGEAGDVAHYDYCHNANINIVLKRDAGVDYLTPSKPGTECEGDCDTDSDCSGSLQCYQRTNGGQIPGCENGGAGDESHYDYCYKNGINTVLTSSGKTYLTAANPGGLCEGTLV